jgi:hypothetical protein
VGVVALWAGAGSGGTAALGIAIAGLAGHSLSGPIVHLAHGHPLTALASLGLEGGLPAFTIGLGLGMKCSEFCGSTIFLLLIGTPLALSIGTAVDSAALAWDDNPKARDGAPKPAVSLAPLVLPPLRMGALHLPPPAGAALVGTF